MKKFLGVLMLITLSASLLVSCTTNPTKLLPKKTWSYTATETYVLGSSSTPGSDAGTATFKSDGTGTATSSVSGSSPYNFTWSYDKANKKMTINDGSSSFIYDVTETKTKEEKWHYSISGTIGGTAYSDTRDWTLNAQ